MLKLLSSAWLIASTLSACSLVLDTTPFAQDAPALGVDCTFESENHTATITFKEDGDFILRVSADFAVAKAPTASIVESEETVTI